jgi:hypothetical protein
MAASSIVASSVTTFGADGRVISHRESTTRDTTTIYDGPSGRVIGKATRGRSGER